MRFVFLLVVLVCCASCKKGYDKSQMASLTAPELAIVGKYELKTELTSSSSGSGPSSAEFNDLMQLLTMLEGGTTKLECFPDKTYVMSVGETPVKGTWNLEKAELRLKIDKIGELRPEQIAKVENANRGVSGWNMTSEQRDEFLTTYRGSVALELAESLAKLRVAADGTLYSDSGTTDSIFGGFVSYFTKKADKD